LGIALLPSSAVAREVRGGRLVVVELIGAAPIRRRITAIRRHDLGAVTGPVAAFLEILSGVGELLPDRLAGSAARADWSS
jgi:DNA-binding transcriptional LysR family regulator